MTRDLKVMETIMKEKEKEVAKEELHPLDPEGQKMGEHKRFTLDMVGVPVDPLR